MYSVRHLLFCLATRDKNRPSKVSITYLLSNPGARWGGAGASRKASSLSSELRVGEVWHGENYTCLGFGFGRKDKRLVYISDVSEIPETTMNHLARGGAGTIAVLVLDAMTYDNTRPTHQSVKDALSIVRALKPRRTYLVGMSCRLDHATTNDAISKEPDLPCPVELAYDGLIFDLPLDA